MISVIGDVMLDEFWFGRITRLTPESENTPIVKIDKKDRALGGAANVALNISKLGEPVTLHGLVGADWTGQIVINLLKESNIPFNYVLDKSISTTNKIRVYNGEQYLYRIDVEDKAQNFQKDVAASLSKDIVVLSDYNKGTITDPQKIINESKLVFVDPKKDLLSYKGAFVLKPNFKEFLDWSLLSAKNSIEDFVYANYFELIEARRRLNVENLVITAGKEGCLLITEKVRLFKAPKTDEVDVTGAGDTFLAGLVCKYKETEDIKQAVRYANLVASTAVSKKGTSYVTDEEASKRFR